MSKSIGDVGAAYDVGGCIMWAITPEVFASQLLTSAKRYARFLNDSGFASSHSSALEIVAKASGFANWHAFHTVVKNLFDAFNPEVHWPRPKGGREPMDSLTLAVVLLVVPDTDLAPTEGQQSGLRQAAAQLSDASGVAVKRLLEMIARMCGADTWAKLLLRKPEESKTPLYGFHVYEEGDGRFIESSACRELIEQQDELFQDYFSRSDSEQNEFQLQLQRVLASRPDFLEGLLAQAEIIRYDYSVRRRRGQIYSDAIAKAEALIPKTFKGEIVWGHGSNRFYHRLLYNAMVFHAFEFHQKKALLLARKQLRLNKSDNLGVRMWLPVLLVSDGQLEAADKACKKMSKDLDYPNPAMDFIMAICHFASGRMQRSAESLFRTLLKFPSTRHVVAVDFEALYASRKDPQSLRPVTPDVEMMIDMFSSVSPNINGFEGVFAKWLAHPSVLAAEPKLAKLFHDNWRAPHGNVSTWADAVATNSAALTRVVVLSVTSEP